MRCIKVPGAHAAKVPGIHTADRLCFDCFLNGGHASALLVNSSDHQSLTDCASTAFSTACIVTALLLNNSDCHCSWCPASKDHGLTLLKFQGFTLPTDCASTASSTAGIASALLVNRSDHQKLTDFASTAFSTACIV